MNISELYRFVTEISEELPEIESNRLIEIRDSLEEIGPSAWAEKLEDFANEMLLNNIGNHEVLTILEAEAENSGSTEIKSIYLVGFVIILILVVAYYA
jgi:hypothetical protein